MSWGDWVKRRFGRAAESTQVPASSTPREQWTVRGVFFDTSGWVLNRASAEEMVWTAPSGMLSLSRTRVTRDLPVSLREIREVVRSKARAGGEGIVEVDVVPAGGGDALRVLCKRRRGSGYAYRGVLELPRTSGRYVITAEIDEGNHTGVREAMVNAARLSMGEVPLDQLLQGGGKIPGFALDPYDAAFDEDALHSVSDDSRLDPLLPGHPLSRARASLATIVETLVVDDGENASPVARDTVGAPSRPLLPHHVLRSLFASAERHDLVEQSLRAEIDELGDTASLPLARCLVQLGISLHMRGQAANAVPLLSRAGALFEVLVGEDAEPTALTRAHHGVALMKLSQRLQALPLLLKAIARLEKGTDDLATYTLALANAAQLVAEHDAARAQKYLERAQSLLQRIRP